MSKSEEFEKMALEMGGERIKLTPGKEEYLDVFELNNNRNKFQEDFDLSKNLLTIVEVNMEYPKESGRICICTLDNGDVIESKFIICPDLGIQYFEEVVNTGRYVVSWKYK